MRFFSKKDVLTPLDVPDDISVMIDNVGKEFKKRNKQVHAIKSISFAVKKGEFFSIIGRSGSGKTTLLNILGTMIKPSTGRIAINGKTIDTLSEHDLTMLKRFDIATVYQNYNLIPVLTAYQNVELPLILVGWDRDKRRKRTEKLLNLVGLIHRRDHKPEELSGGEKQRVSIARALANQPKIILADEPTGDLDWEIGEGIIQLLEGINRDLGTTLILVTHDRNLANRADRMMEMRDGEIVRLEKAGGEKIRIEEQKTREKKDPSYY